MMKQNTKQKRILVVDDDADFLIQMRMTLETAGYHVHTASGRVEAEAFLAGTRPDLVFLDLMMEEVDGGFALSYHIKKKDPTVPVVIVSSVQTETGLAFDATTDEEKSWIKADAFLAKPVRFEQMQKVMNTLMKDPA